MKRWVNQDDLEVFVARISGRRQSALVLWQAITELFTPNLLYIRESGIETRDRQDVPGGVEVSVKSLQAAMDHVEPNWITGYGPSSHRLLGQWLESLERDEL